MNNQTKTNKKRVLLTFIESGMGHITSIQSIADNLRNYYADNFELIESYIMQEDGDRSLINFENFIIKQTKNTNRFPGYGRFIFWFLSLMGGVKFMRVLHRSVFRKFTNHCLQAFKKRNPDVIVSTHYFLTFVALEYKKKINKNVKVITYNPDNNVHCWWDNREHLFLVNNKSAYFEAIGKRKFNPALVHDVGFIARNEILQCNDSKENERQKLGIDKDKFCVIVADGAYACAKSRKVTNQLLKTNQNLTLIMVAGKNKKLFEYYNNLIKKGKIKNNINLIVLPFTKNIYEYYKVADVFITKAGPNAVLDAVFMGTPVLIDYYAHPIEKATLKLFVDELQVGKAIFKPQKIKKQIENWVMNNGELLQLKNNTIAIDKFASGGVKVADAIWQECTRQEFFVSTNDYYNNLYSLAHEHKFDSYTTPINYLNVKKQINYKKIEKKSIFNKQISLFIHCMIFLIVPFINFFYFGFKVKGRKNLKGLNSAITISNHVSKMDCLWTMQILKKRRLLITVAPHNNKKGLFGKLLEISGVVPLPSNFSQGKNFVALTKNVLKKRTYLHFYAEQALWRGYRQSRPLKKGAFYYASKNNVPVVPIVYCFRKNHRVTAFVCPPIYPKVNLSTKENCNFLQNEAQKIYDQTIISFYGYDKDKYKMDEVAIAR